MTDQQCPKCQRTWPANCEQAICIERHQECFVCRFVTFDAGTQEEADEIAIEARARKEAAHS